MKSFDFTDIFASFKWIWKDEKDIFEKEFAEYIGSKYAIGTSYGRTALYLGLKAIDVKDKEVIIPAFTCTVVRHAVTMAGAIPQFVDINLEEFDFDIDDLKRKISSKTKAIVLTHFFGHVAKNITEVLQIAKKNNLIVIEDCAHSLGAEYNGRKTGLFGDFSIFSLTKNMINYGGGVLVTDDNNIYQKARDILKKEKRNIKKRIIDFPIIIAYGLEQAISKLMFDRVERSRWWVIKLPHYLLKLRQYLLKSIKFPAKIMKLKRKNNTQLSVSKENSKALNYNYDLNMEPIIASLGRTQLKKINSLIDQREKVHNELINCINCHFGDIEHVNAKNVYTHLVLRFHDKNIFEVIEGCKNKGLLLRSTWPTRQRLWKNQVTANVKKIEKEVLIWNVNPDLTKQEIEKFIQIINSTSSTERFSEKVMPQHHYKST